MSIIEVPEVKKNSCFATVIQNFDLVEKYSSYSKLIRIVAYCFRFRPRKRQSGPLNATYIKKAEKRVLKLVQATEFADVIEILKGKPQPIRTRIANLDPFLDDDGLIRIGRGGGRLQRAQMSYAQKHPILLPNRHRLSDSIIREIHQTHFHAGIQTTLYIARQRFWILDGRNQVRQIVRACIRCFRFNPETFTYKMGNLPSSRVLEAIPFSHTGVDFCGPFHIKEKKHRNRKRVKTYVCVFVCMAIKAVHLEVVSELTSEGFMAALRRFAARRGLPEHVYSDNGTNFTGACNQLKELYVLFNTAEHRDAVGKFASEHRLQWHFIPPAAPHFGGLWEASVKIFKHHLKRVVEDLLFTFEEFSTFVTEIEGIINSRPITTISSDPNDLLALTPSHYLIGNPTNHLP